MFLCKYGSTGRVFLYKISGTHHVSLSTQFQCNVGSALQTIAGSMLVNFLRRWPNTSPTLGLLYTWASTSAKSLGPSGHVWGYIP